jgi:hypothetical protein
MYLLDKIDCTRRDLINEQEFDKSIEFVLNESDVCRMVGPLAMRTGSPKAK